MSDITIEKRVPPPAPNTRMGVYPWPQMNVGDSVLVKGERAKSAKRAALQFGARHSQRWVTRAESGGFRIWRMS